MAGARVAASPVDLFHDDTGFNQAQVGAAIFFWDQGREPTRFGEGFDKFFGESAGLVKVLPIAGVKLRNDFGEKDFAVAYTVRLRGGKRCQRASVWSGLTSTKAALNPVARNRGELDFWRQLPTVPCIYGFNI